MELEAALLGHPAVSEAAVVTRPDEVKDRRGPSDRADRVDDRLRELEL